MPSRSLFAAAAAVATLALVHSASAQGHTCAVGTQLCPSTAPCCSENGWCGSGEYCMGGCNPLGSYSVDSCMPKPICEPLSITSFDSNFTRVHPNATMFNGNATEYDFTLDKGQILNDNGALVMVLAEENGGTKLSSTRYILYGTMTARMKISKWAGVISTMITMSDVKDEIDYEFVGANSDEAQTNFFWLGVANYTHTNGQTLNLPSGEDGSAQWHDYTINWTEDKLEWLVDGNVIRTVNKEDTLKDGKYNYPATPSRLQFSIWPSGISSSAKGTIEWGGGMVDWSDPDYLSAGYFYASVQSVTIICGTSSSVPIGAGDISYVYDTNTTAEPVVEATNSSYVSAANRIVPGLPLPSGTAGATTLLVGILAVAIGAVL